MKINYGLEMGFSAIAGSSNNTVFIVVENRVWKLPFLILIHRGIDEESLQLFKI